MAEKNRKEKDSSSEIMHLLNEANAHHDKNRVFWEKGQGEERN